MSMILILPWLPIVLAVGVGSRLLDRVRGLTLGSLGALFWVVLIQASVDPSMFMRGWLIVSLLVGSATIIAVGVWSGHTATARRGSRDDQDTSPESAQAQAGSRLPVADILRRFDDWLEAHRHTEDPWPEFGEFLRTLLYDFCQATHVRPYRILSEGDVLMPLRALEAGDTRDLMSARKGIAGHVATAGVSYIAGDPTHGQLIDELAEESAEHLDWCFAIQQGGRRIGLVKAAQVSAEVRRDRRYLEAAESLVSFFWATLIETCRSRAAQSRDSVSGLLTRESFQTEAERALQASYAQSEPAAVAVIALEGIRSLSDRGDWETADALVAAAASQLLERLRSDDQLGRFDDSRFVLLLRRVDSALASLIATQLVGNLAGLCDQRTPSGRCAWTHTDAASGGGLSVRCGVSGSGTEHPSLSTLISRAITQCHEARRTVVPISSDLDPPAAPALTEPGRLSHSVQRP